MDIYITGLWNQIKDGKSKRGDVERPLIGTWS